MVELSRQEYSSHIVRAMLTGLCGGGIPDSLLRSRSSRSYREFAGTAGPAVSPTYDVPPAFTPRLRSLADIFIESPSLASDVTHPSASPVVQTLLLALHRSDPDKAQTLSMRILANAQRHTAAIDTEWVLANLVTHHVGSHVLERVLQVAGPGTLSALYLGVFRGQLGALSRDPVANYTVQHLLPALTDPVQQKMAVEELLDEVEAILAANSPGVVVKMTQVAAKAPTLHKQLIAALLKAFHITEPGHRMLGMPGNSTKRRLSCHNEAGGIAPRGA